MQSNLGRRSLVQGSEWLGPSETNSSGGIEMHLPSRQDSQVAEMLFFFFSSSAAARDSSMLIKYEHKFIERTTHRQQSIDLIAVHLYGAAQRTRSFLFPHVGARGSG